MFKFMPSPTRRHTKATVMSRPWLRAVAACLVAVLLGAQMAVAAYACPLQMAGVAAGASLDVGLSQPSASSCDAMDMASPNLCVEHCKYGQQIDQAQAVQLPMAVLPAMYTLPPPREAAVAARPASASPGALASAFPPHAILHCVLRI